MKLFRFWALLLTFLFPLAGHAQHYVHNTGGDFGLRSGTQAPPGFYVVPLIYDYRADTLRDRNGNGRPAFSADGTVDAQAGIVGLLWVSEKKVLGGNYGFSIWPGVTNNEIAAPIFGLNEKVNSGFADLYIRPLELGWHADRADFVAGLGLYAPTGEWDLGGDNNRGLGMWSYELFGGATVYFDEAKT